MASAPSSYLQYLPEVFRTPPTPGVSPFLGRYLKIFEALLTGRDDAPALPSGEKLTGLEEILERFPEWEVDRDNARLASTSTVRGWETLPVFTR